MAKKILSIFIATVVLGLFSSTTVSAKDYQYKLRDPNVAYPANPSLILEDAECWKEDGRFDKAIELYKLYEKLTGQSAQSMISDCELPEWYDKDTMVVMPIGDYSVLILFHNDYDPQFAYLWDDNIDASIRVPDTPVNWYNKITEDEYEDLLETKLTFPVQGLFGGRILESVDLRGTGDGDPMHYQPVKRINCRGKAWGSANGRDIEGGYIIVQQFGDQEKINELSKINAKVYFYPVTRLRNVNGNWQEM